MTAQRNEPHTRLTDNTSHPSQQRSNEWDPRFSVAKMQFSTVGFCIFHGIPWRGLIVQ